MAITQVMGIQYDEDRLSIEEQEELEEFAFYLLNLFEEKIQQMGLHVVQGLYNDYITKFTEEELERMKIQYEKDLETHKKAINS